MYDFSIVVPAYNEEGNLNNLMKRVAQLRKEKNWNCELVIINDCSKDRTGEMINRFAKQYAWVHAVHRKKDEPHGMGYTLKEGMRHSKGKIIFWVMADLCDDISKLNQFVSKINNEGYDIVVGSRYIKGGSPGDIAWYKAIASFCVTGILRVTYGIPVHDITNAFRGFRRELIPMTLKLKNNDFAISPEQMVRAAMAGYRLGEVPVVYRDRVAGKSSFKFVKMGFRYIGLIRPRFQRNN